MKLWKRSTGAVTVPTPATDEVQELRQQVRELEKQLTGICRQEQELILDRQRYKGLFERSLDAILTIDRNGRILAANPATTKLSGYAPAELEGRNIAQYITADQLTATLQAFHQTLLGASLVVESALFAKDGRRVEILATGGPITVGAEVTGVFAIVADVTARKQAERGWRDAQREWQATFDALQDGICLVGAEGKVLRCNRAMSEILGQPENKIIGRTCQELTGIVDEPAAPCSFARVRETRQREMLELRLGSRWWQAVCDPLLNDKGELIGAVHTLRDITARRELEAALRASEEKARQTVNALPQLAWESDDAGQVTTCNERWYAYTGQTADQARGLGWMEAVHAEDRGRVMMKANDAASHEMYEAEYRLRRASDGAYRWHLARAVPIRDAGGKILNWFGSAVDIEDQKRTHATLERSHDALEMRVLDRTRELTSAVDRLQDEVQQRLRTEAALRESEERYRLVFQNSSDAICVVDCQTMRVEHANDAAARLHGYTREELLNLRADELSGEPENTRASFTRIMQAPQPEQLHFRHLVRRKDGMTFVAEVAAAVYQSHGRWRMAAVSRDITERQRLEREVLEISERERRRIGQDLQDSVCQQLAGVTLMAKALADKLASQQPSEAQSAAEIGRVVNIALSEGSGLARSLMPVDLQVHTLVPSLQELAALVQRLFRVECKVEAADPLGIPDELTANQLYRIAQEAISNAIRNGHAKHLLVQIVSNGNSTTLSVRDDGSDLQSRGKVRNGIGQRLLQYRAEMIGGTLEIAADINRHTVVTCTFPSAGVPMRAEETT